MPYHLAYLQILLGTVLVIVLFMIGMHLDLSVKNKTVGRITAGFLSGFSAATTSISGPPVALYFLTEGRDKLVTRANMCWIFAFGNIGTMFSLALSGSSISGDLMLLAAYVTRLCFWAHGLANAVFIKSISICL